MSEGSLSGNSYKTGDIISHLDITKEEGAHLQRGMNFHLRRGLSVILMSVRPGAPYHDQVLENGQILIYEGHDVPSVRGGPDPKTVNQPMTYPRGSKTQNGLFYDAAVKFKQGVAEAELVKVYEKIKAGIWVFNGLFKLVDSWQEASGVRKVFKFRLELLDEAISVNEPLAPPLSTERIIPTAVKQAVWKRDKGQCVLCGSSKNLHFDHIIPWSKGGTSLMAVNVQLLCAEHNLNKRDHIV